MSQVFRAILIIVSVVTFLYIARKLKKSQVEGYDAIFWLIFSTVLILLSVFPGIAGVAARLMGIQSTENAVFLIIIFTLLMRSFLMSIRISQLNHKIRLLAEQTAILEKKLDDLDDGMTETGEPYERTYMENSESCESAEESEREKEAVKEATVV